MKTRIVAAGAALAVVSMSVHSAESEESKTGPWYVGGSLASATHVDGTSNNGITGRLTGGYRINEYLSAEVGYSRLIDSVGVNLNGAVVGDTLVHGVEVAARGEVPVTDAVSAFGRVGVLDWRRSFGRYDAGSGHDLTGGLGLRYAVSKSFSVTGSFDYYNDVGIDSGESTRQVNLGAQLSF